MRSSSRYAASVVTAATPFGSSSGQRSSSAWTMRISDAAPCPAPSSRNQAPVSASSGPTSGGGGIGCSIVLRRLADAAVPLHRRPSKLVNTSDRRRGGGCPGRDVRRSSTRLFEDPSSANSPSVDSFERPVEPWSSIDATARSIRGWSSGRPTTPAAARAAAKARPASSGTTSRRCQRGPAGTSAAVQSAASATSVSPR